MKTIKLELSFSTNDKLNEFDEFLNFKLSQAGSYLHRHEVKETKKGNSKLYTIESDAMTIYLLGYDWALWQFPPTKK